MFAAVADDGSLAGAVGVLGIQQERAASVLFSPGWTGGTERETGSVTGGVLLNRREVWFREPRQQIGVLEAGPWSVRIERAVAVPGPVTFLRRFVPASRRRGDYGRPRCCGPRSSDLRGANDHQSRFPDQGGVPPLRQDHHETAASYDPGEPAHQGFARFSAQFDPLADLIGQILRPGRTSSSTPSGATPRPMRFPRRKTSHEIFAILPAVAAHTNPKRQRGG